MESVSYISQTIVPILGSSTMARPKEKGDYFILMGIFILEIGKMIKLMVMASTFLGMGLSMKEDGSKI